MKTFCETRVVGIPGLIQILNDKIEIHGYPPHTISMTNALTKSN